MLITSLAGVVSLVPKDWIGLLFASTALLFFIDFDHEAGQTLHAHLVISTSKRDKFSPVYPAEVVAKLVNNLSVFKVCSFWLLYLTVATRFPSIYVDVIFLIALLADLHVIGAFDLTLCTP